ncbi:OmpH family outer membrane protein [bacterium SCSIO 12643]|nr:OmpH family outer membrane protein [bacterium SCSIO 12643]
MLKNFLIIVMLFAAPSLFAQRYAYVDSKYILENMDEYKEAQLEIDAMSKRWQETIEAKMAELDRMRRAYEAEKILLTDELKKQREQEIKDKEQEIRDYQRAKFGVNGELFKKRQELIQPLQDDIFNAIKELAKERSYALIFDKGTNTNILFADPKYDKSDVILKKLGYSAGDK